MTRRGILFAIAGLPLLADDSSDVLELFTGVAAALSEANLIAFLRAFDRSMPGYEKLEADVSALLLQEAGGVVETPEGTPLLQDEVQSSIDVLSDEKHDSERKVELDWFLQLVERQDTAAVTRRRERVRCRLTKMGKSWKIESLEPLAFLAPPEPRK